MPSASTPARRRSPHRSASRRTRSTGWGCHRSRRKAYLDAIPVGYAVTYIFGTIGSAIVLAQLGPKLIGVDLAAACADYEKQMGGGQTAHDPGVFSAYRQIEVRAYRIDAASGLTGKPVRELFPGLRIFVERIHRGDEIIEADGDSTLEPGDVVAISGPRSALVEKVEAVDAGSRRPRPARHAGHGGRRVRAQQGSERADAARACGRAVHARHLPAEDHAQHDRDTGAARNRDPARRHPHDRRQHAPRRRCRRGDRPRRPARREHRSRGRGRRHRDRRPDRRAEPRLGRHPDQPVDVGRRAARGPDSRLPAHRPSDLRQHSRRRRSGS